MSNLIDKFRTDHRSYFKNDDFGYSNGFTIVKILPELRGCKLDSIVLSLCEALGATSVRITTGEVTCDANTGRATIYVDNNDIIKNIEMEICFKNPSDQPDIRCGSDMNRRIRDLKGA